LRSSPLSLPKGEASIVLLGVVIGVFLRTRVIDYDSGIVGGMGKVVLIVSCQALPLDFHVTDPPFWRRRGNDETFT
jgi:hypothetical protein